jgi:hypothetical protein
MRNARDLFGKKRDGWADIGLARYKRPRGIGLHVVELQGSGVEIIIGSVAGNLTFAPGDQVHIGSLSGRRNPTILGFPPAGAKGGGAVPLSDYSPGEPSAPIIYAAHPLTVPAGSVDYRVILVGRSLMSAPVDYFEAILWDEATDAIIPDPLVIVHDPEYIADPTLEGLDLEPGEDAVAVLVDVDSTRAVGSTISYRAGR